MAAHSKITVYGAEWCADCRRVKRLLDERAVSYDYRNIEEDPSAMNAMHALNDGRNTIPVVVWDNNVLEEPTNVELLSALGLTGNM